MAGAENRVQQAGKLFPKTGLLLMESAISKVEYEKLLAEIKQRIRSAQTRAALAVNRELVLLYWQIGREIVERQSREGWGAKVIERLAADLGREFPEVEGFGARNLRNMRDLAREWPDGEIVQQLVAKLPWGHNMQILRLPNGPEREWYARAAVEYGWSRAVLVHQIETKLYQRQGKSNTNFTRTLPPDQSDMAQQILKDPYHFDFLTLGPASKERELERGLLNHLRDLLLELGKGFAFLGSQYKIEVDERPYYIDLLFYHVHLHSYVVIDLKVREFEPEYAGKMNFYLSAADALLRREGDAPSIGLILCKGKGKTTVEYALRDTNKPIGVSSYQHTLELPQPLQGQVPSIEDLEDAMDQLKEDQDGAISVVD
jgi:predicted nuclease of restriction endonuclease-like (RecB) superfamily